jgi:hypothetical protein
MRGHRIRNLGVALLLAVGMLPLTAASSSAVVPSGCYITVDNPHPSGSYGMVAKIRFACAGSNSMRIQSWIGNLYKCTNRPSTASAESTWTGSYGCRAVATNSSVNDGTGAFTVPAGATVTRYIPKQGTVGPQPTGSAWWIACVRGYTGDGQPFARATSSATQY